MYLRRLHHYSLNMGRALKKIIQTPLEEKKGTAEIVLVTHHTSLTSYKSILQRLEGLNVVQGVKASYRIEGEGK
ncbi:hypothetical protein GCM10020331_021490 [Ectobacillus funiculus]